jgi:cytochrome P450
MKGFADAAPAEVRDELRRLAPYLEMWVLMKDGQDHARIRQFLNLGFNATVVHSLRGWVQQSVDDLLDGRQNRGRMDASGNFAFLLPAYVLSDLLGVHQEDRGKLASVLMDVLGLHCAHDATSADARRKTRCKPADSVLPQRWQSGSYHLATGVLAGCPTR